MINALGTQPIRVVCICWRLWADSCPSTFGTLRFLLTTLWPLVVLLLLWSSLPAAFVSLVMLSWVWLELLLIVHELVISPAYVAFQRDITMRTNTHMYFADTQPNKYLLSFIITRSSYKVTKEVLLECYNRAMKDGHKPSVSSSVSIWNE